MLKNLYTFSKSAWHVKLFKWVYGTDPTKTFNTMCPYFWSMVATLILFPLILIIKIFGKSGTALLKSLESRKRDNLIKNRDAFLKRCSDVNMTDKEAYDIKESKCWDKYYYDMDSDTHDIIYNKYSLYKSYLKQIAREKELNEVIRKEKFIEIKESKYFVYFAYLISAFAFSSVIYILYSIIASIKFSPVDWEVVTSVLTTCGQAILLVATAICVWRYIIVPIYNKVSCMECKLCKLGLGKYIAAPFIFTGKGILIIGDMIYMTYKKACPRITWKNEEK